MRLAVAGEGRLPAITPEKLEIILRHFREFRAIFEDTGNPEFHLPDPDGGVWILNVLDIDQGIRDLPPRQRAALALCCIYNRKEVEVARIMGLKKRKSVGQYKQLALQKLIERAWAGYAEDDAGQGEGD